MLLYVLPWRPHFLLGCSMKYSQIFQRGANIFCLIIWLYFYLSCVACASLLSVLRRICAAAHTRRRITHPRFKSLSAVAELCVSCGVIWSHSISWKPSSIYTYLCTDPAYVGTLTPLDFSAGSATAWVGWMVSYLWLMVYLFYFVLCFVFVIFKKTCIARARLLVVNLLIGQNYKPCRQGLDRSACLVASPVDSLIPNQYLTRNVLFWSVWFTSRTHI
jgi:hypothetical protein